MTQTYCIVSQYFFQLELYNLDHRRLCPKEGHFLSVYSNDTDDKWLEII